MKDEAKDPLVLPQHTLLKDDYPEFKPREWPIITSPTFHPSSYGLQASQAEPKHSPHTDVQASQTKQKHSLHIDNQPVFESQEQPTRFHQSASYGPQVPLVRQPKTNCDSSPNEKSEFSQLVKLQESMVDCQRKLIAQQQENNQSISSTIRHGFALPKTELMVFNGDPLDYWTFVRFFDNNILTNTTSDSERLTYLLQYCSGKAKEAIKSCATLDPSIGYNEARRILSKCFGDPYHIAISHVNKLTNGHPMKPYDASGLLDFALQLKSCVNTLTAIGYLNEINSSDNLRRIAERLPYNLKSKWLSRTRSLRTVSIRPGIQDLSDFVQEQAEEANDPVFGDIMVFKSRSREAQMRSSPKKFTSQSTSQRVTTMVTQAQQDKGPQCESQPIQRKRWSCPACEGFHSLQRCFKFKEMSNDDRVKILRRDNICFNCFRKGHYAVGCAQPPACTVENCKSKHQTIMHRSSTVYSSKDRETGNQNKGEKQEQSASSQCNVIGAGPQKKFSTNNKVFMKIVPVKIRNKQGKYVETYALLDSGSDISLCNKELLTELNLISTDRRFFLTTQERKNSLRAGRETSFTVEAMDGTSSVHLPRVWAIEPLNVSENSIVTKDDIEGWPHLQDINLSATQHIERKVKLLIGCNVPEAFYVLDERRGSPGEPYGVRTLLGWTVFGPSDKLSNQESVQVYFNAADDYVRDQATSENIKLTVQLEKFWKSDFGDSLTSSKPCMSVDDRKALRTMEGSLKKVKGHYQIALPWKNLSPCIPNNRIVAEHRLNLLKKKLLNDKEICKKYCTTMNEYFDKEFAVRVPEEDLDLTDRPVWFLPHHGVFHPQKPEKLRVVFDCSAKYRGTSLNDQLYQGPDLTNNLCGVLTRFRQNPVALVADIEAMYHQVLVDPKDQDAFRFLWWPNNNLSQEPVEFKMRVHVFGATSSPSCASYSLRRTTEDNKHEYDEAVIDSALTNFYVDDFMKSVKKEEEAIHMVENMTSLMSNWRAVLD